MSISEYELHAFIDGELEKDRAAEIAKMLESDPALAARVAAYRADKERLKQTYGALDRGTLPDEWLRRIEKSGEPRPAFLRPRISAGAFAAVATSLVIVFGIWLAFDLRPEANGNAIIAEAMAARRDSIHPQQEINAVALGASEARDQVLTAALAMRLKVPDLARLGYQLATIRVFEDAPGGKAVELRYRGDQNRLFTLYLRHPTSPPRVDLFQQDGVRVCIWQDDVIGTVMVGEMSAGEMARTASAAYAGLNL